MTEIDWTTLRDSLQADIASGEWKTKSYQMGPKNRVFRDISEILEFLQFVESKAAIQAGTVSGRTYARQVRRH